MCKTLISKMSRCVGLFRKSQVRVDQLVFRSVTPLLAMWRGVIELTDVVAWHNESSGLHAMNARFFGFSDTPNVLKWCFERCLKSKPNHIHKVSHVG